MRKTLLSFLLAVAGAIALQAQPAVLQIDGTTTDAGRRIFNWGRVAPGTLHTALELRNTGSSNLYVSDVHPSCGCTVPEIATRLLKPGEGTPLKIALDVQNSHGPVSKLVEITWVDSSSGAAKKELLYLQADVRRAVTFAPSNYLIVTDAVPGSAVAFEPIRITNTGDAPFVVRPPKVVEGPIIATFDLTAERTLAPGEELLLKGTIVTNDPEGVHGQVALETTAPSYERVTLNVVGNIRR